MDRDALIGKEGLTRAKAPFESTVQLQTNERAERAETLAGQISGVENRTFRTSGPPLARARAHQALQFLMLRRKYGHFITGHTREFFPLRTTRACGDG